MEVRSEAFNISMQKDSVHHEQPSLQSMRLAYAPDGTAIYKPISSSSPFQTITGASSGGNGTQTHEGSDSIKKKRGRPRKYATDGSGPVQESESGLVGSQEGLNFASSGGEGRPVSSSSANPNGKKRGRPPGSTNKKHKIKMDPLVGSGGIGFAAHVITVKTGEDLSSKIMSFSQNGPRAICVLSANGAISNVTLRQAATSGGTVTYEGRFEILSLSGSYMSENGAHKSRAGGLSVSLAGPDGRVLGGGVAGLLIAASPVQVIIGSFIAEGKEERKEKKEKKEKKGKVAGLLTNEIAPGGRVLGTGSESSGGAGSPFNHSNNININSGQPSFSGMHWK